MTPAFAGWIVLGILCVAALILMLLGVFRVVRAQRDFKSKLKRLEEAGRRTFDPERLQAALTRISTDAASVSELVERARGALSTIAVAVRYCALAVRIVKLLT